MSFASVLVMTITLSVLSGILLAEHVLRKTLDDIETRVDVTVYVIPGTEEEFVLDLRNQVSALPEVAEAKYVSERDALQDFRERHADDQTTLQALDELDENPIGAQINIRAKEISQYESISKFFGESGTLSASQSSIIDHIDYNKNKEAIEAIEGILQKGRLLSLIVTLVLALLSIIVTFNTVRLAIYFAREEIAVMRLVGASRGYIQGPFIVEGAMYGFVATILTLALFIPVTAWLGVNMTDFFQGINLFAYYKSNMLMFFIILLVFGVGLGALSSVLAARKHLKI